MSTLLIHAIELTVVVLVVLKFFQIRSLYNRSRPTKTPVSSRQNKSHKNQSLSSSQTSRKQKASSINKSKQSSETNLPLPEVSFSFHLNHEHNDKDTSPSTPDNSKPTSHLSCYIDDFFADPADKIINPFSATKSSQRTEDSTEERDEFITIQEQNAKIIREMSLQKTPKKLAS